MVVLEGLLGFACLLMGWLHLTAGGRPHPAPARSIFLGGLSEAGSRRVRVATGVVELVVGLALVAASTFGVVVP